MLQVVTSVPVSSARPRRSLIGMAVTALHARARSRGQRGSRLAAAVTEHAMTFAAMAAIDTGMFRLGFVAGWVAVGVSLLLADFKIQG
jgi:hypothetical protein